MAKALFEEIFDGPDSLFGRIFGPSSQRTSRIITHFPPKPTLRVTLTAEHLEQLHAGKSVTFNADGQSIIIRPEIQ